jgi:hypothetical protein
MRRPDLFIIGAPKSGTTSLYEYLEGHPEVFMSPVKEPGYFSGDVNREHRRRFNHPADEAKYLALFADARGEKRLGEASTRYVLSPAAAGQVKDFQPDARIVAILRNPVDMIHSLHGELVSTGDEDIPDFEQALAADDDRRQGRRLPPGANPLIGVYREQTRYATQLARWLDAFGRERVHIMIFDDLVADTPAEFRRLLEFLEVDPDYQPAAFGARNKSHQVRRGLVGTIRHSRPVQWTIHRALPAVLGQASTDRLTRRIRHSRLLRAPAQRDPVAPELRSQLEHEFAPEVDRLSALLGRDLGQLWFGK